MLRLLMVCLALCALPLAAQPANDAAIPPALKDWRPWVLKDQEFRACPFIANSSPKDASDYVCAWPGRLKLSTGATGATFAIHWRVDAPAWVPLPGDAEHWPQQVTVNQQRQPVLSIGSATPAIWLVPGSYEIAGTIPWREQPQSLAVPQGIGLVALTVDGKAVPAVRREGNLVTLGRVASAAPEADSVELRVYRKLSDGVPAMLETQILIGIAGQAREESIGPVLPAGFEPVSLSSEWPARLDGDGRLHVQVQAGSDTITLQARASAPLAEVVARLPAPPWPKQEIWSYEADPHLRITTASGAVQVDPRQSGAPPEWQVLPAFALGDGAKLRVEERSRGLAPDEGNRLTLQREAWLDFAGTGWYARDHLGGVMTQGWRFDVAAPFTLEQATAQNSSRGTEPLLITTGPKPGESGVEWRTPRVDLAAGVRIGAPASLPVAGWQQTFDNVQATLHFPFGYKLLAAPGADVANGSWIAGWTLLDIFACAILALVAWRLFGLAGAAATVVYLLLGYQERGAPLWTLLAALALALIVRALPPGRLGRAAEWLRRAALLLLVIVALPFVAAQVRAALYPQLEGESGAVWQNAEQDGLLANFGGVARNKYKRIDAAKTSGRYAPPPPPPVPAPEQARASAAIETASPAVAINQPESPKLETIVVTGSAILQSDLIDHYSETTVVQTGRGLPSWNIGSAASLSWSGPVLASQTVHLLVAPPWLVRPLRLVLVALLAWLLLRLFRSGGARPALRPTAAAAVALVALLGASAAHAQSYPGEEMLAQLKGRLTEAPRCAPQCAAIAQAQVSAKDEDISVALEAHVGDRVAMPLPYDAASASIRTILVDGVADDAVVRNPNGQVWIALGRGVHRVQIDYAAAGDKIALAFPLKPARVLFDGHGWEASGLSDDRLLTETLNLARARDSGASTPSAGAQQFPPYVRVTRSLKLGLQWTANTVVERLSPAQGGFTVDVPPLAGEHVATAGIRLANGKVPVAIGEGEARASWSSTLDKSETLTLTAPALGDRAEVWRIVVSPTWHAEFSGVPGVGLASGEADYDYRDFEFHPLPGETLTLRITRPAAVQGEQRAIDSATLRTETGQRAATHVLSFALRASQGGDETVTLPKDAEVLAVSRDNAALNVRSIDGRLALPVVPGEHRYDVRFRDNSAIGFVVRTPVVALGEPAANVSIDLQLPADRWLLATSGPPVGPAVLYWGELLVLIAIAFVLARTRRTRLRFRDWLLLGLGFSTFSWIALVVVVVWLFAFDWRARAALPARRWAFNLAQGALVLLTIVALFALASAIPQGLLGEPDMHVAGYGSYAHLLHWFADRSAETFPTASAVSLPLWVYKLLMLAWALWLANALIGWLRDGFAAWTKDGYWRAAPKPAIDEPKAENAAS
ncbi:MAG TPA: hypothetical protein VF132_07445 [Rudaea sp.]